MICRASHWPSGVASPRTTAVAAGRGPAPETRTIAQRSGSEPQTDQWPRSPARGSGRMSSSLATATHPAPCISTPSTGRPQSKASTARHAQLSINLWPPWPLPRFPTPERRETRTMPAKDGLRLNPHRAGSARAGSSRPAGPGHCRAVEDEAAHASGRC